MGSSAPHAGSSLPISPPPVHPTPPPAPPPRTSYSHANPGLRVCFGGPQTKTKSLPYQLRSIQISTWGWGSQAGETGPDRGHKRTGKVLGNSLVVQWLGLGVFTAGAWGSIPGGGTKIPQATQYGQNTKTKQPKNGRVLESWEREGLAARQGEEFLQRSGSGTGRVCSGAGTCIHTGRMRWDRAPRQAPWESQCFASRKTGAPLCQGRPLRGLAALEDKGSSHPVPQFSHLQNGDSGLQWWG